MIKFVAGLALGFTISAAMGAEVTSYLNGQKITSPVIDCGPSNKATMIIDMGMPMVVPFTEELLKR